MSYQLLGQKYDTQKDYKYAMQQIFKQFDNDESGTIDLHEFSSMLHQTFDINVSGEQI